MDNNKREQMILDNLSLVKYIVNRRFHFTNYEDEDLIMIGTIGLIKAVDTYDETRNDRFAGYAYACIYNEIAAALLINSRHQKDSIHVSYNAEETAYLQEAIPSNTNIENKYIIKEETEVLRKLIEKVKLNQRDLEIAKLYYGFYGKRYTQDKIASTYNMTRANVQLIIKKFLKELTKLMLKEYGNDYLKEDRKKLLLNPKLRGERKRGNYE